MVRRRVRAMGALLVVVMSSGCGRSDDSLVIFAASSLTDVFDQFVVEFEAANPGVDVVVNYGGSPTLVAQIADGAPVDVLATADPATMARAERSVESGGEPIVFAENSMVVAVEAGNPLDVRVLGDLERVPVVVLAAPEVPAGAYAAEILARAGLDVTVSSYEQSVRSVVSKIALGEADAGLVYRTDVGPSVDGVEAIDIPSASNVTARYPIVQLTENDVAEEFVAFVTGPEGAAILTAAGFVVP